MSICFLIHSGLGNLIQATPMLQAIRQAKPDHLMIVCTNSRSRNALRGWRVIDNLTTHSPAHVLDSLHMPPEWLIISPTGALVPRPFKRPPETVLIQKIAPPWRRHEVDVNMDFARAIGYTGETPPLTLPVKEHHRDNAYALLKEWGIDTTPFITLNSSYRTEHPWPYKHWGDKNYARLIDKLNTLYALPIVIVGDSSAQVPQTGGNIFSAAGWSSDILDTAALIERSMLIIGNDGALQHVAAAMSTPSLTLFTFTNPIKNRPYGPLARTVMVNCPNRPACQHGDLECCQRRGCLDLPFESVWTAAATLLDSLIF